MTNEEISSRLLTAEVSIEQIHRQIHALQLCLSWLMHQTAPEEAQRFLSRQANEMEGNPVLTEHVAMLDELRASLALLRVVHG